MVIAVLCFYIGEGGALLVFPETVRESKEECLYL